MKTRLFVVITLLSYLSVLAIFVNARPPNEENWVVALRMPEVQHRANDIHYCHSIRVADSSRPAATIVGFEHVGPPGVVHHMFAYACSEPYSHTAWQCSSHASKCRSGRAPLLYAWANNAPALVLPPDVGYPLSSHFQYVVVEMHYGHGSEVPDSSGLDIHLTTRVVPFNVGIYLLAAPGMRRIPGNQPSFSIQVSCTYNQGPLTAFAYRVHAHKEGQEIYCTKHDNQNPDQVVELGRRNPQLPQSFVSMPQKVVIHPGDMLSATCVFNTTSISTSTNIGAGMNDEMCNFYIMGYTPNQFPTMICSDGHEYPF